MQNNTGNSLINKWLVSFPASAAWIMISMFFIFMPVIILNIFSKSIHAGFGSYFYWGFKLSGFLGEMLLALSICGAAAAVKNNISCGGSHFDSIKKHFAAVFIIFFLAGVFSSGILQVYDFSVPSAALNLFGQEFFLEGYGHIVVSAARVALQLFFVIIISMLACVFTDDGGVGEGLAKLKRGVLRGGGGLFAVFIGLLFLHIAVSLAEYFAFDLLSGGNKFNVSIIIVGIIISILKYLFSVYTIVFTVVYLAEGE
ncbi:hypothetical protein Dip518_001133 [Parelusimicrobium proximum]|uniref:hypothetical protein n=1 Tax=Parelusimicrobium proximum TaxID=3228953 RepID=UPI003D1830F3